MSELYICPKADHWDKAKHNFLEVASKFFTYGPDVIEV